MSVDGHSVCVLMNISWTCITYSGGISDWPTPRGTDFVDFFMGCVQPSYMNCVAVFIGFLRHHGYQCGVCVFIMDAAVVRGRTFQTGEVCKALKQVQNIKKNCT